MGSFSPPFLGPRLMGRARSLKAMAPTAADLQHHLYRHISKVENGTIMIPQGTITITTRLTSALLMSESSGQGFVSTGLAQSSIHHTCNLLSMKLTAMLRPIFLIMPAFTLRSLSFSATSMGGAGNCYAGLMRTYNC